MSEIIVTGLVKMVGEETTVSSSFTKRELVVSTEEQYPQHILINFPQGKCNPQLDMLAVGSKVSVSVNLRGREWLDPKTDQYRYFNDIQGWKVSINGDQAAPTPAAQPAQAAQAAAPANNINPEETEDDLLF